MDYTDLLCHHGESYDGAVCRIEAAEGDKNSFVCVFVLSVTFIVWAPPTFWLVSTILKALCAAGYRCAGCSTTSR